MKDNTRESVAELSEIRHKIDDVDATLLTAFAERERLVRRAARLKLGTSTELFDTAREQEVLSGARMLGVEAHSLMNHVLALNRLAIYDEIDRHRQKAELDRERGNERKWIESHSEGFIDERIT